MINSSFASGQIGTISLTLAFRLRHLRVQHFLAETVPTILQLRPFLDEHQTVRVFFAGANRTFAVEAFELLGAWTLVGVRVKINAGANVKMENI